MNLSSSLYAFQFLNTSLFSFLLEGVIVICVLSLNYQTLPHLFLLNENFLSANSSLVSKRVGEMSKVVFFLSFFFFT